MRLIQINLYPDIIGIIVTGYGSEELDSRFSTVPILQKPIEPHALHSVLTRGTRHAHPPQSRPSTVATL